MRRVIAGLVVAATAVAASCGGVVAARAASMRAGSVIVVGANFVTPLRDGGSTTVFSLNVPKGAACQGDSMDGQYRVQSFLIPAGVDPGSLDYSDFKPQADGAYALYASNTSVFWNSFTDKADRPGGPGTIIGIPPLSFKVFKPPFHLTPGEYQIGIACTLFAKPTRYWSTAIRVVTDAKDLPAHIAWRVVNPPQAPGPGLGRWVGLGVLAVFVLAAAVILFSREKPIGIGALALIVVLGASVPGAQRAEAVTGGTAQIASAGDGTPGSRHPLTSGDAATPFALQLPAHAACSGDSQTGQYRVQSFMVPSSVDPSTLTFDAQGPVPNGLGAAFRQPLYKTSTQPYVNAATNVADKPGDGGAVIDVPAFTLQVIPYGQLPAGDYTLGIACTKGAASAHQLDKYWSAPFHIGPVATGASAAWSAPASSRPAAATTQPKTDATDAAHNASPAPPRHRHERVARATGGEPSMAWPLAGLGSTLLPHVSHGWAIARSVAFAGLGLWVLVLIAHSVASPARPHVRKLEDATW